MAVIFRIPHQSTSGGGTTYDVEYGTGLGSTHQMTPDTDYMGSEDGTNRWNFTHFGDGSGWNGRNFMRYTRWSTVEGSPVCGFGFDPTTVLSPETWDGLGDGPFYLRFRMRTNAYMGAGGHNGGMKFFIWAGPGIANGTQRLILFIRNGSDGGGTNADHTTIDPTAGVSASSAPALAPNGQWNHIQIIWFHGVAAANPYIKVLVNNNNDNAPDAEQTAFTDLGGDWEKAESWSGCNWGNIVTDNSVSDTDAELDFMDIEFATTFDSSWFPEDVTVDRTLTCSAGSYTYTGLSATLSVVHSLSCSAGAYVYTGQSATLSVDHSLVCESGAYTYTGNDATFDFVHSTVDYTINCDSGSYSYTGNTATLNVVHSLVCDAGSYSYEGQSATLSVDHSLECLSGSYNYSGNPATLNHVFVQEQNSGGYEDYSRHPYLRSVHKKEKEKYLEKQSILKEDIEQIEAEILFKDRFRERRQIRILERKLYVLQEQLDSIKILNALLAEQEYLNQQQEEVMIMLLLAA